MADHTGDAAMMALFGELEGAVPAFLGALGPTAGVVVVVWYFLRHISEQSSINRKAYEDLFSRVESVENNERNAVTQWAAAHATELTAVRADHRKTVDDLLALNREALTAIASVSSRLSELSRRTEELREVFNATNAATEPGKK